MKKFFLFLSFLVGFTLNVNSQCTIDAHGQFPSTSSYNPVCGDDAYGVWVGLTNAWSREYSVVNVSEGSTYEFQTYRNNSSRFTTVTTLSDIPLVWGITNSGTSVFWTATFSGEVKFWTHANSSCEANTQNTTRRVRCSTPVEPGPCINTFPFAIENSPSESDPIITLSCPGSGQWTDEYSTWNNTASSKEYRTSSSNGNDWITITTGAPNGNVINFGASPIVWTSINSGTYYVHVSANSSCAQDFNCRNITMEIVTPLPVELILFEGESHGTENYITWITASELNCKNFTIERSTDGKIWNVIKTIDGSGTTSTMTEYEVVDRYFNPTINYYRLTQVDFNGEYEIFNTISIDNRSKAKILKTINMMGQEVNENYKGVVIHIYSDGSIEKKFM